jgi:hypothetical protein
MISRTSTAIWSKAEIVPFHVYAPFPVFQTKSDSAGNAQ